MNYLFVYHDFVALILNVSFYFLKYFFKHSTSQLVAEKVSNTQQMAIKTKKKLNKKYFFKYIDQCEYKCSDKQKC